MERQDSSSCRNFAPYIPINYSGAVSQEIRTLGIYATGKRVHFAPLSVRSAMIYFTGRRIHWPTLLVRTNAIVAYGRRMKLHDVSVRCSEVRAYGRRGMPKTNVVK